MGHERINEVLKIKDPKNGSKYKKLLREPNHENIVDFLTTGKGKWSSTKKNPHEPINRGSLTGGLFHCFYHDSHQASEHHKGEISHHLVCLTQGIQVRCMEDN